MSSEDIDKHDGAEDVDFGEGEDFDETPAEGGPKEDTEVEKETATASDDNTQAAWEAPPADVTAEHTAPDAGGGAAEEAVTGDVLMTDPKTKSPEVADANGVGTADEAAAADGDEAVASKSAAVNTTGGGADPLEEPPHGSEVFVGGIPKTSTVTDEQLLEFAQAGGEVFSCAVLTEPGTGQNRGYGFIKFKSKEIAQEAMSKLNDTQMKDHSGVKIRVLPSQSKNRLYLGNLPKEKSKDELHSLLKSATKGLESVELLMSKDWPGQNRGFCFLEFYNHACAQAAKAALSPPNFQLGNKPLTITFAEPRRADTSADQSQEIKSIFVGNLPDSANEAKLRELFAPLGEITRAFIPAPRDGKKRREFGFVHFQDRSSVVQAIANHERGEKLLMDSTPLEVKMGRVYHETPPQRLQQNSFQQGGFGGRGMGNMGMSMGAGRFGGGRGAVYQQQQAGPMGGAYGMNAGYGGDYGQYSGAMTGMTPGYGGQMMDGSYGGIGGSSEYYDSSYGGGMGGMGASRGMGSANGAGMAMVPMMLPNGQVGYVLSNAGAAGGMAAGGSTAGAGAMAGAGGMGMGGPMRGRTGYGGAAGRSAGGYGGMGGGRTGSGYGGRGTGQQRYTPY